MKIELKPFQETATSDVLDELADAREAVVKNKLQAVVLSAPTGSGKTITIASVIDQVLGGGDALSVRPNTRFLWLSDSPELNAQSKAKLLAACDYLPFHRMITIDSDSFDEERLQPGHVYFINTQLLGKDKRLTQGGDKRQHTFWQTVANTIAAAPEDFILIIDEAHRGAAANDRSRTPIMQKFILGSDADGLPPVPLVLGMSATPQRFTALLGNTNRTQRPINITADDVRSSGLLKDMIVVRNPKANTPGDLTLLEHAAGRWQYFTQLWKTHCEQNENEIVRPVLVVQVQDGTERTLTRTNLSDVVRVIERKSGPLSVNEIVHCFQEHSDIEAGGRIIRKLEASRIQDTPDVKVVIFKTALTTGWDCPRAEVMMSFRRAQDSTSIAQLVGRMIRTPLARRIVENEVLNTVELSLPHYNADALETVLKRLRNPEAEEGLPSRVETSAVEYSRNQELVAVFDRLKTLPTYAVKRVPKMGDVKRALRLAGMLVHADIDANADDVVRDGLTSRLRQFRDAYAASDVSWSDVVREGSEIDVDVSIIAIGQMAVTDKTTMRMSLSEENIDQLFDACGRRLAAGEGLHRTYWKRYHDQATPNKAKLELFAVTRHPETQPQMDKLGRDLFDALWTKNKAHIRRLSVSDKTRFNSLRQASGKAVEERLELPDTIVEKKEGHAFERHLYCNDDGEFFAKFNSWEQSVLEEQMKDKDFVGWLRNPSRRDWALCVPYELGGTKAFYPDFLIVRKVGKVFEVDILEPHDDTRTDTWAKAKGLAIFADDHGLEFGRLVIARKKDGKFQIADMNDKRIRDKARKMQASNDLDALFS